MKVHFVAGSVCLLLGLVPLACGGSDDEIMESHGEGPSSAGSQQTGGSDVGSGGNKATGGSGSGGSSSTAGSSSGGRETGGGGRASGGTSAGGTATGGSSSGGGDEGGAPSTGSGGAPSSTCSEDSDCGWCAFTKAPTSGQQCYCPACVATPMSNTACAANKAQFDKFCTNSAIPCPNIRCPTPPRAPVCQNNECVAP
jgi:hypothetical protein